MIRSPRLLLYKPGTVSVYHRPRAAGRAGSTHRPPASGGGAEGGACREDTTRVRLDVLWRMGRVLRYTVILERESGGMVVAQVPALRGCVSQGRTKREALRNIKEAIALYVETLLEHGRPVPTEAGREVVELTVVGR